MTLDQFINELLRRAEPMGHDSTRLCQMRDEYGTIAAVRALVEAGEARSGFVQLQTLNLTDWSLETAVVRYPEDFSTRTIKIAQARLAKTPNDN